MEKLDTWVFSSNIPPYKQAQNHSQICPLVEINLAVSPSASRLHLL
jgi:hypothetical protein